MYTSMNQMFTGLNGSPKKIKIYSRNIGVLYQTYNFIIFNGFVKSFFISWRMILNFYRANSSFVLANHLKTITLLAQGNLHIFQDVLFIATYKINDKLAYFQPVFHHTNKTNACIFKKKY